MSRKTWTTAAGVWLWAASVVIAVVYGWPGWVKLAGAVCRVAAS